MMTNKSQIKWSAGLCKWDLADDEDQRANLRVSDVFRAIVKGVAGERPKLLDTIEQSPAAQEVSLLIHDSETNVLIAQRKSHLSPVMASLEFIRKHSY
jgi:hypothetical protein